MGERQKGESGAGSRLTVDTLRAAMEKVANAPSRVCGVTEPHIVHPKAAGWSICGNCLGACFVCLRLSGCDDVSHDIRCNNERHGTRLTPPGSSEEGLP